MATNRPRGRARPDLELPKYNKKPKLFVDSGAFSAMTQGIKLDQDYLDQYIDFVKRWEHVIDIYANVDVIQDPEATYHNQKWYSEVIPSYRLLLFSLLFLII